MLSYEIAELGIYPVVDPLDSTSHIMGPNIVGSEHYDGASGVKSSCRTTDPSRISLPSWVCTNFSKEDKLTVSCAWKIQHFLSQSFQVAGVFMGHREKLVPLKETIKGFQKILTGEYDHLPEQAFYMEGPIEECAAKADNLAEEHSS
ncbi:Hypothetical predicted protein [Marmota monax]|uniref:ATP synthase subunit beta, mitochondrial n=1 Tax=Marmota monax TaxID=9995 RepID=A0A5E4DA55_MARMO|nr:hypothetical protein GHT09_015770 [Marmota monax]VTJ91153.1 Hypothetical predicted protein [Marmota monax]